jgi:hypothetical protein
MIIEHRNPTLKYPRAIKDEKTRLVLDWLLEFRFSSIDILSARIGQTATNANRFFNGLIRDGVIQSFKNVHTKNQRYVMITSAGVSYLEALGRDTCYAVVRVANLGRYSQIIHDLSVQAVVLPRLSSYKEVVWDRHISFGTQQDRPDAILRAEKNGSDFWSAIEFERWRKDKKRIYISLINHSKNFDNKYYAGVYYIFQSKADCIYYEKVFNEKEWPQYERMPKSGQIKNLGSKFVPGNVINLRKRFAFRYEPLDF